MHFFQKIILIPGLLLVCINTSFASVPDNFQIISNEIGYKMLVNNSLSTSANAGIGCYNLGEDVKCFSINIDQQGGSSCQSAVFAYNGRPKQSWSNFICGAFAITELLNDPRTTVGYYNDDLLKVDFIDALNNYYIHGKRIEIDLGYGRAPAIVYVYGTSRTTQRIFDETSNVIENMIMALSTNQMRQQLDGQRFILINTNDYPSQMPGLSELALPTWVDTSTRAISMSDIKTTIFSEEMICRKQNPNLRYFGYEQVIHEIAYTFMDALQLGNYNIEEAVRRDTRANYGLFTSSNQIQETFPLITKAWFDSNFSKLQPYTRTELRNQFPATYNYMAAIFNPSNTWKPQCYSEAPVVVDRLPIEPIYHDFYYYPAYYTYRDYYRVDNYGHYRQHKKRYIFNLYIDNLFAKDKHKKRGYSRMGKSDGHSRHTSVFKPAATKVIPAVTTTITTASPKPAAVGTPTTATATTNNAVTTTGVTTSSTITNTSSPTTATDTNTSTSTPTATTTSTTTFVTPTTTTPQQEYPVTSTVTTTPAAPAATPIIATPGSVTTSAPISAPITVPDVVTPPVPPKTFEPATEPGLPPAPIIKPEPGLPLPPEPTPIVPIIPTEPATTSTKDQ